MDVPTFEQYATRLRKLDDEKMALYGITRKSMDYFHFGAFRYSNLDDAIAQAKRANNAVKRAKRAKGHQRSL
jgi:hypothetical protein